MHHIIRKAGSKARVLDGISLGKYADMSVLEVNQKNTVTDSIALAWFKVD